jgi:hypothetical protein
MQSWDKKWREEEEEEEKTKRLFFILSYLPAA